MHHVLHQHPVLDTSGLAIGGKELKALDVPPGPRFGETLEMLLQRVLDDPALNDRERLMQIVREEIGS